jgi:hypothetical protein
LAGQFSKNYRNIVLKTIFTQERINALLAALVLIGVALVIVGVWRYFDAAQRLQGNLALEVQQGNAEFDVNNPEQAQGLVASDIQKRRLERQQNEALVVGGIGLGTLALGWILNDVVRSRRRTRAATPVEEAT